MGLCIAAVCHQKELCFVAKKGLTDFCLAKLGCSRECPDNLLGELVVSVGAG